MTEDVTEHLAEDLSNWARWNYGGLVMSHGLARQIVERVVEQYERVRERSEARPFCED